MDLTRLDDATFEHIEDAFETYSVLVFPNQNLDDDAQIAFSLRFGDLEKTQGHIANNFQVKHVSEITNLDPDGKLMAPDDPRAVPARPAKWHSDSSFKRVPAKASLLHARKLPPDGGDTQFASLRARCIAGSAQARARRQGRIHHYTYWRHNGGYALTNEAEDKRFPPVPQAMIRANPVNGRKALYVGSHASHIRGMPEDEGRALLKRDCSTSRRRIGFGLYLHHWKVGDLSVNDRDRAALHRARPYKITEHPRILHRTTVMGEGPTVAD